MEPKHTSNRSVSQPVGVSFFYLVLFVVVSIIDVFFFLFLQIYLFCSFNAHICKFLEKLSGPGATSEHVYGAPILRSMPSRL